MNLAHWVFLAFIVGCVLIGCVEHWRHPTINPNDTDPRRGFQGGFYRRRR